MKNRIVVGVVLLCSLFLTSCTKDKSQTIAGTYTYKTSGTVTLLPSQLVGLGDATLAMYRAAGVAVDPVVVGLYPEQGQMNVLKDGDSEGNVKITFNDLLGNADVTSGRVDGSSITLESGHVKAAQLTDGTDKIGAGIVAFSGSGKKYDDVLIIDFQYQGKFTVSGVDMTVVASDVHCVAKTN